jgi:hypothetical protein
MKKATPRVVGMCIGETLKERGEVICLLAAILVVSVTEVMYCQVVSKCLLQLQCDGRCISQLAKSETENPMYV